MKAEAYASIGEEAFGLDFEGRERFTHGDVDVGRPFQADYTL